MKDIIISSKNNYFWLQNGIAYYALAIPYSETLYSLPLPLNSAQDETLIAECNSIHFMDNMHKAIREGTLHKETA